MAELLRNLQKLVWQISMDGGLDHYLSLFVKLEIRSVKGSDCYSKAICFCAHEPGSGHSSEVEDEEEEEEEVSTTERTGADHHYDKHMDEAAEEEGLRSYRDARANEMFPDEVDTPIDAAARIR